MVVLKKLFLLLIMSYWLAGAIAQDTTVQKKDSGRKVTGLPAVRDTNRQLSKRADTNAPIPATTDTPAPRVKRDSVPRSNPVPVTPPVVTPIDTTTTTLQDTVTAVLPLKGFNRRAVFQKLLKQHPWYNFDGRPLVLIAREKPSDSKDMLFYVLVGLVFYLGLVRAVFTKYLDNLFSLFFRATLRQQQMREQVLQSPLPSFLLNLLFTITGGMYLDFLLIYYKVLPAADFWINAGYLSAILAAIYLGKFFFLKLVGWMFRAGAAADVYLFVVFLVNKILGIFLLPFIILLAFVPRHATPVVLTVSFAMILVFYGYRFISAYRQVRQEIKLGAFHFFLYLCAFEIAPLLLIYKVLLSFVESV